MHLFCSGLSHHFDYFTRSRAAHDRIVDNNNPLAFQNFPDRIKFDLDSEMPDSLSRFNEGTPHVMVAYQTHLERNPGFLGVPHGSRNTRVRHCDDHIRIHFVFARQLPS